MPDEKQPSGPLRAPERQGVRGVLEEREHSKWLWKQVKKSLLLAIGAPPMLWTFWQALARFWEILTAK